MTLWGWITHLCVCCLYVLCFAPGVLLRKSEAYWSSLLAGNFCRDESLKALLLDVNRSWTLMLMFDVTVVYVVCVCVHLESTTNVYQNTCMKLGSIKLGLGSIYFQLFDDFPTQPHILFVRNLVEIRRNHRFEGNTKSRHRCSVPSWPRLQCYVDRPKTQQSLGANLRNLYISQSCFFGGFVGML